VKKILNLILKTLLPVILGAVILYWIYRDFDFSRVADVVCNEMNLWWFALSTFFGVMSHVLRGWRWRLSLAPLGYAPRTSNCVYAIFIAYAANLVVPRVGEVSRCAVLDKCDKVPFVQSLGTVVAERLIDTIMVLTLVAAALLLQWKVFYTFFITAGGGTNDGQLYSSVTKIAITVVSVAAFVTLGYFIGKKFALLTKIKTVIRNFWEGVTALGKMKNSSLFVIETVGIWFCYFMQFYLCFFCFSFSSNLSIAAGLLLFVAGSVAVVVPTPNGAGPWHFAIISMMVLYGVSQENAGMFALIVHSSQTALVALLGVIGLMLVRKNEKNICQTK
jgi:uncharacterized membrane protein YbhN (UPF0104 family)